MSWFWTTLILVSFAAIGRCSEGNNNKHEKKVVPSAILVGTVYCGTCFLVYSKATITGATVAVECNTGASSSPSFRREVRTNKHGEFRVPIPLSISKHVKKIKGCSVKLISSNHPYCAVAATAASSSLHLKKLRKDGTHIFSAGFFTFKPQLCDQKPSVDNNIKRLNGLSPISNPNDPSFPPPIQDPPSDTPTLGGGYLPPLPQLPTLPPLPPLPRIPFLPSASQFSDNAMNHPEHADQLPPGTIPTIPLQPPPSAIPPVLPAVPGLMPPSAIPEPPFPSQLTPGFSGVPPAEVYSTSRTSFP